MSKKKIKVKVKKRRVKMKRIILCLIIFVLICLVIYYISKLPIKNIYVIGNNILSDKEVMEEADISNYPSFLATNSYSIKKKLENNVYIEEVSVKKKFFNKLYIYIIEKKIICSYDGKLLLEDGTEVKNDYGITNYPILTSSVDNIKSKFAEKFSIVDSSILLKISEIEYVPNNVDSERFALKMNDGNLVYITLNKIEKINKYNSIYSSLDGKRGIIYLDSGDYVEIKEE